MYALLKTASAALVAMTVFLLPALASAKVVLKLGHNAATNHHYHITCLKFKEAVEKRSNGTLEITVFPNDQLGNQRQLVEGTQLGTTDMVLTSDSVISNFEDKFAALNMPFLFRDIEHVGKTMDGPIGDYFADLAAKKGMIILAFWENGFRVMTNSKRPIVVAKDLEGLKMRISPGFLPVDIFRAFGALPTPMATGEVYSALQLGTVDGQENALSFVPSQKYYEVQKFLSITHHQHNTEPLVISRIVYDRLKPDQRALLREEARKLSAFSRQLVMDQEEGMIKELTDKITINRVKDASSFEKGSQPVYDKYKDRYGDIIEKIKAVR